MIRETSIEAYIKIKENGLLSRRRWQVYAYVFRHGPVTARECHKALANQGTNSSSFIGRFSELRNLGVIKEIGKKLDQETGQTVLLWDVTKNLPAEFEKSKKIKCKLCDGKGYRLEQQTKFRI